MASFFQIFYGSQSQLESPCAQSGVIAVHSCSRPWPLQGPSCPPTVSLWARWLPRPLCHQGLLVFGRGSAEYLWIFFVRLFGDFLGSCRIGLIFDFLWNLLGISLESLWNLYGISLEHLWNLIGISLESFWDPFGISLESLWNLCGISLESLWI